MLSASGLIPDTDYSGLARCPGLYLCVKGEEHWEAGDQSPFCKKERSCLTPWGPGDLSKTTY